jgi:hypothetical protein
MTLDISLQPRAQNKLSCYNLRMMIKKEFFKGVLGFTEGDEELLAAKAEESVYYWWWMFMRIHPVLWYARTKGIKPIDPKTFEIYNLVGDLSHDSFYKWWNETGRKVFAETDKIPEVTVIDLLRIEEHKFKREGSLYLDIPLNISRRKIMKEVRKKLDAVHEGQSLNVTEHSTAKLKLFTKKYRLKTLENEYWVLLYKMLHSKIRMWQIGDRLQLAPRLKVRGHLKDDFFGSKFNQLNSLTSRYYFKAKNISNNLMAKEFPNYQKRELIDELKPFGDEHQADYLKSTKLEADRRLDIKKRKTAQEKLDERNAVHSEFHQWLISNFANTIKWEVIRRNNIENSYKNFSTKVHRKLPNFITGLDDQLV